MQEKPQVSNEARMKGIEKNKVLHQTGMETISKLSKLEFKRQQTRTWNR